MNPFTRILRSRRGDLLLDGMVGAIVVGIIFSVTVGALLIAGQISSSNSHNAARLIHLNTQLTETIPRAAALSASSAPERKVETVLNRSVESILWVEPGAGTSVVYARTASYKNGTPEACLEPVSDQSLQKQCLLVSMPAPDTLGGIKVSSFPLKPGSGAVKLTTDTPLPAGTGEVRYLFTVKEAPGPSSLTFTATSTNKSFAVDIPAGGIGNYYGSLSLPLDSTDISIATTGPASYDDTNFLLYGAPTL